MRRDVRLHTAETGVAQRPLCRLPLPTEAQFPTSARRRHLRAPASAPATDIVRPSVSVIVIALCASGARRPVHRSHLSRSTTRSTPPDRKPTRYDARMEAQDGAPDGAPHPSGFEDLYRELHQMAGRLFRSQRAGHTLQATALVHEAYLKMASREGAWNDRTHFLATAARAMRQILVNHARDRGAAKRGGGVDRQRVTLAGVPLRDGAPDLDVLSLNEALEALARLDARQARVAELRTFGGQFQRSFMRHCVGRSAG